VESADDRLRALLSTIGVHAGHYGELPTGQLKRLREREGTLGQELGTAREQRRELEGVAADLDAAAVRQSELTEQAIAVEQASLRSAADAAEQRWERSRALAAQAQDRPAVGSGLQRELVGREQELRRQLDQLEERERTSASAAAQRADEIAECGQALSQMQERVEALGTYAQTDPAGEQLVRDLVTRIQADPELPSGEGPDAAPERNPVLTRFRECRDDLIARRATQDGVSGAPACSPWPFPSRCSGRWGQSSSTRGSQFSCWQPPVAFLQRGPSLGRRISPR